MIEEWRSVRDGYYSVSNLARVRRDKPACGTRPGRIVAQTEDKYGYLIVHLNENRKDSWVKVHVLVAEAFLGPRTEGITVNHKDLNKKNNIPENLEYLSAVDNYRHAMENGKRLEGVKNGNAKLTPSQVKQIQELRKQGWLVRELAEKFDISIAQVSRVSLGRQWKCLT